MEVGNSPVQQPGSVSLFGPIRYQAALAGLRRHCPGAMRDIWDFKRVRGIGFGEGQRRGRIVERELRGDVGLQALPRGWRTW